MKSLTDSRTPRSLASTTFIVALAFFSFACAQGLPGLPGLQSANASTSNSPAPAKSAASQVKVGTPCATAGATTTLPPSATSQSASKAMQTLTCTKTLSGKLVWAASTAATPMIAGGRDGGPNDGPSRNPAFAGAFAKYTACLKAQGVTLPAFGGRRGFGGPDENNAGGANGSQANTTPAPRPTLSAKQQAAMTKCASLRPAFGRGGFGGPATGGANSAGGLGGGVANTPANVATYIACLNTNGVNISTLADLQGLDRQSPKIATALAACRSKRVAQGPGN